ncbi:MAG: biopolymer transporter ExbD [Caldimicrobium sp.]|nr:biopolymer transporter ExbD [Caldimicrobium sp.]MCX7874211.1 biopolymer transporter ExbD [Caldimicrobium sp.]MDW8094615.1 biopolymer transporter ExbD [Caldimicrobium sp.]
MHENREFDYINVIPLVDIMLVLLTIVLVTATFIVQGEIPLKLPQAKHAEVATLEPLRITLTKEGKIFWEAKEVTLKELETLIKDLPRETPFSISADKEASVQSLVSILDLLKGNGYNRISLKTEKIS